SCRRCRSRPVSRARSSRCTRPKPSPCGACWQGGERAMTVQEHAAAQAAGKFNAGETIIEHVSNSSHDHPLLRLPTIAGIDFSVTKHVLMLWLVAATIFI